MDKLLHYHLKDACLDEDNFSFITTRICSKAVDMTDAAIVDACVKAAQDAGINDLWLLDKKFVLDALLEKITGAMSPMPRWISVEERLPDANLAVLGYGLRHPRWGERDPFPAIHVVYTRGEDEGWFTFWDNKYVNVTHWMPLHEPPKGAAP